MKDAKKSNASLNPFPPEAMTKCEYVKWKMNRLAEIQRAQNKLERVQNKPEIDPMWKFVAVLFGIYTVIVLVT